MTLLNMPGNGVLNVQLIVTPRYVGTNVDGLRRRRSDSSPEARAWGDILAGIGERNYRTIKKYFDIPHHNAVIFLRG